jgi:hypothetical protein
MRFVSAAVLCIASLVVSSSSFAKEGLQIVLRASFAQVYLTQKSENVIEVSEVTPTGAINRFEAEGDVISDRRPVDGPLVLKLNDRYSLVVPSGFGGDLSPSLSYKDGSGKVVYDQLHASIQTVSASRE